MDWSSSEWKQGLSSLALQKVNALEEQIEKLNKERLQKQLHFENLEQAYNNQKRKVEEEKSENSAAIRDAQTYSQNLEDKARNLQNEVQSRDTQINMLKTQLAQLKTSSNTFSKDSDSAQHSFLKEAEVKVKDLEVKLQNQLSINAEIQEKQKDVTPKCLNCDLQCENKTIDNNNEESINSLKHQLNEKEKVIRDLLAKANSNTEVRNNLSLEQPLCTPRKTSANNDQGFWGKFESQETPASRSIRNFSDSSAFTPSRSSEDKVDQLEKRLRQLTRELECQRYNWEAIKAQMEQKFKEKESMLKSEVKDQAQVIANMDAKLKELMIKLQQEKIQISQSLDVTKSQLDKVEGSKIHIENELKEKTVLLKEQEATLNQHKSQLNELQKLNRSLESSNASLQSQIKASEESLNNSNGTIKQLNDEIKNLTSNLEEKEKTLVGCNEEIGSLKHQLQQMVLNNNQLTSQREQLENEKKALGKESQLFSQEVDQLKSDLETKVKSLENATNENNRMKASLENQLKSIAQLTSEKGELEKNLVKKSQEFAEELDLLKANLEAKIKCLESSTSEVNNLQATLENQLKQNSQLQETSEDLEKDNKNMKNELEKVLSEVQQVTCDINEKNDLLEKHRNEINQAKGYLENQSKEKTDLEKKNEDLSTENGNLKCELAEMSQKLEQHDNDLKNSNELLMSNNLQIIEIKKTLENELQINEDLLKNKEILEKQIQDLESQIVQVNEQLSDKIQSLKQSENEIVQLNSALESGLKNKMELEKLNQELLQGKDDQQLLMLRIEELTKNNQSHQENLKSNENEIEKLKSSLEDQIKINGDLECSKQDLDLEKERLEQNLDKVNFSLEKINNELRDRTKSMESEIAELKSTLGNQNEINEDLLKNKEVLEKQIQNLESQILQVNEQLADKIQSLKQSENEIVQFNSALESGLKNKMELEKLNQELLQGKDDQQLLMQRIEELTKNNQSQQENLKSNENEIEKLKSSLEDQIKMYSELQSSKDQLDLQKEKLEQDLDEVTASMGKVNDELQDTTKSLESKITELQELKSTLGNQMEVDVMHQKTVELLRKIQCICVHSAEENNQNVAEGSELLFKDVLTEIATQVTSFQQHCFAIITTVLQEFDSVEHCMSTMKSNEIIDVLQKKIKSYKEEIIKSTESEAELQSRIEEIVNLKNTIEEKDEIISRRVTELHMFVTSIIDNLISMLDVPLLSCSSDKNSLIEDLQCHKNNIELFDLSQVISSVEIIKNILHKELLNQTKNIFAFHDVLSATKNHSRALLNIFIEKSSDLETVNERNIILQQYIKLNHSMVIDIDTKLDILNRGVDFSVGVLSENIQDLVKLRELINRSGTQSSLMEELQQLLQGHEMFGETSTTELEQNVESIDDKLVNEMKNLRQQIFNVIFDLSIYLEKGQTMDHLNVEIMKDEKQQLLFSLQHKDNRISFLENNLNESIAEFAKYDVLIRDILEKDKCVLYAVEKQIQALRKSSRRYRINLKSANKSIRNLRNINRRKIKQLKMGAKYKLEQLKESNCLLNLDVQQLEEDIEGKVAEINHLTEALSCCSDEVNHLKQLQVQMEFREKELNAFLKDREETELNLQQEILAKQKCIEETSELLASKTSEVVNLQAEVKSVLEDLHTLQNLIGDDQLWKSELYSNVEFQNIQLSLKEYGVKHQLLSEENNKLVTLIRKVENEIKNYLVDEKELDISIENVCLLLKDRDNRIKELQSNIKNLKDEFHQLQEVELEKASKVLGDNQQQVVDLQSKIRSLEHSISEKVAQTDNAFTNNQFLEKEVSLWKSKNIEKEELLSALEIKYSALEKTNSMLNATIDEVEENLQEVFKEKQELEEEKIKLTTEFSLKILDIQSTVDIVKESVNEQKEFLESSKIEESKKCTAQEESLKNVISECIMQKDYLKQLMNANEKLSADFANPPISETDTHNLSLDGGLEYLDVPSDELLDLLSEIHEEEEEIFEDCLSGTENLPEVTHSLESEKWQQEISSLTLELTEQKHKNGEHQTIIETFDTSKNDSDDNAKHFLDINETLWTRLDKIESSLILQSPKNCKNCQILQDSVDSVKAEIDSLKAQNQNLVMTNEEMNQLLKSVIEGAYETQQELRSDKESSGNNELSQSILEQQNEQLHHLSSAATRISSLLEQLKVDVSEKKNVISQLLSDTSESVSSLDCLTNSNQNGLLTSIEIEVQSFHSVDVELRKLNAEMVPNIKPVLEAVQNCLQHLFKAFHDLFTATIEQGSTINYLSSRMSDNFTKLKKYQIVKGKLNLITKNCHYMEKCYSDLQSENKDLKERLQKGNKATSQNIEETRELKESELKREKAETELMNAYGMLNETREKLEKSKRDCQFLKDNCKLLQGKLKHAEGNKQSKTILSPVNDVPARPKTKGIVSISKENALPEDFASLLKK